MIFIGKLLLNQLLNGDKSSMSFRFIEKRLFACILLVSFLVALIFALVNSLLSFSNFYFVSLGFLQKELALINIAIVLGLIAISALVLGAYLKGFFQKKKKVLSVDTIPTLVTNCLSEFIKGYKES